MINKTIECARQPRSDYFKLYWTRSRRSNKNLQFYLDQFDHKDYWIYKSTNVFKEIFYEDLLEFKYSGYIFFKKNIYSKDHIENWIKYLKFINLTRSFQYLSKPFPNFDPYKKIIIK